MGGFIIKCRQRVFFLNVFLYLLPPPHRRRSALPFLINPGLNCVYRHLDLCLAKSWRVDKQRQFVAVLSIFSPWFSGALGFVCLFVFKI